MPRPPVKRRRSNSKSPHRRAPNVNSSAARQQLERRLANKSIGDRPVDSDDSDRLVVRKASARGRQSNLHNDVFASGAVAKGDKPGAYPTRAQRRRNLESDTKQIVEESRRRSASKSKSISPHPSKSPLSSVHTLEEPKNDAPVVTRQTIAASPPASAANIQQTPSVLGNLKPRRRQASILHLIDNNDSSIINSEDEEQFLPDDVSTPYNTAKAINSVRSEPASSGSRKRKLGSDSPILVPNSVPSSSSRLTSLSASDHGLPDPVPETTKSRRSGRGRSITANKDDDQSIMAPPESSPEPSPERSHSPAPAVSSQVNHVAPTTDQLQSLMPSKRRKHVHQGSANEFDIPEDESSGIQEEDESAFMLRKRPNKGRKKDAPLKTKANKAQASKGKNTKSTTPAPAPATPAPRLSTVMRTPLPLSRSVNGANRQLRSPLVQSPAGLSKAGQSSKRHGALNATSKKDEVSRREGEKSSGGSPLPQPRTGRITRSTRRTEASNDKENLGQSGPHSSSDHTSPSKGSGTRKGKHIARELTESESVLDTLESGDDEVEMQVGRGHADGGGYDTSRSGQKSAKWAAIDEWSLDYEEVDVSTGSNSPMRR